MNLQYANDLLDVGARIFEGDDEFYPEYRVSSSIISQGALSTLEKENIEKTEEEKEKNHNHIIHFQVSDRLSSPSPNYNDGIEDIDRDNMRNCSSSHKELLPGDNDMKESLEYHEFFYENLENLKLSPMHINLFGTQKYDDTIELEPLKKELSLADLPLNLVNHNTIATMFLSIGKEKKPKSNKKHSLTKNFQTNFSKISYNNIKKIDFKIKPPSTKAKQLQVALQMTILINFKMKHPTKSTVELDEIWKQSCEMLDIVLKEMKPIKKNASILKPLFKKDFEDLLKSVYQKNNLQFTDLEVFILHSIRQYLIVSFQQVWVDEYIDNSKQILDHDKKQGSEYRKQCSLRAWESRVKYYELLVNL